MPEVGAPRHSAILVRHPTPPLFAPAECRCQVGVDHFLLGY